MHTKVWFPSVYIPQCRDINNLTKSDLTDFTYFVTGFNRLRYHRQKMEKFLNTLCRLCFEGDETANHLAIDCGPLLIRSRDLIGDIAAGDWTVQGVLKFVATGSVRAMLTGSC